MLSRDHLLRRAVIICLMWQGGLHFEPINHGHLIDFKSYFARELDLLAVYEKQGLIRMDDSALEVTATGWYPLRAIAMVFDKSLQAEQDHTLIFSIA